MDDATTLIGDLQQKLAQLDHKVAAYRLDMAAEFTRYSRDLLENIPEELSTQVRHGLAASLSQYPALGSELELADLVSLPSVGPIAVDATTADLDPKSNIAAQTTELSPPLPDHTEDDSTIGNKPASPNHLLASPSDERDVHLQGVFTPNFLPLLSKNTEASPKPSMPSTSLTTASATSDEAATMGPTSRKDSKLETQRPLDSQTSLMPTRPHHERKGTNDTTSSGASESGEHKVRRSALRRSSTGGSKPPPSPRRVRFEFEGGEVLPTSSPRTSEVSLVLSHSLHSSNVPPPEPESSPEDDSMSAEAILGPDEDNEPPPKKVSSSQALRALSRTPLDANTIWTVINADSPEPSSEKSSPRNLASPSSSRSSLANSPSRKASIPDPSKDTAELTVPRTKKFLKSPPPEREERASDDSDSSDDDFLAMAKPKSFANKKAIRSPPSRSPTRTTTSPPISPKPQPVTSTLNATVSRQQEKPLNPQVENEEEGIFDFEGLSSSKASVRPASPPEDEEEEEEVEEEDEGSGTPKNRPAVIYSTSPAVRIPPPRAERAEPQVPAHLLSGSVGSYRGRPVSMPVVKDPQVYAQAASLRDVNSFIGGLDGDTGTDEGDLASYRASVGQALFSGTPRSLTERMMMEDAQAARRAAQRQP
ncbi:conserved hypothetical protein [Verticillium alfalfae VaMs.102]|uniref:Uncharacterized protein n=1 Tax=Verticillium alfalfae (strain VaMs.102 / ATCC MYA-4576 / FGSC 10136) TaxID=526221 RepID=C9SP83_VERA1|nr:conserved hypothetical protein [Verticillium alfalfae VaMs.102]EEY20598.1 conserved hypothetical protein [Verticillium alfalfae VaMs.102]